MQHAFYDFTFLFELSTCRSKVCAIRSITVQQVLEPVIAEAMAGLYAMLLEKELGGEVNK
jgi:hypothetical protein